MLLIMYNVDNFKNPEFSGDIVIDMDDEIDTKMKIADLNVCQVYEWLPYTKGETVPEDKAKRFV